MCTPSKAHSKLNCFKGIYPYLLHGLKSGLVMTAGDILAQTYIENKDWDKYEYERTAKYALIGLVFTGPLLRHWSSLSHKYRGANAAVNKTLTTQIFMAPALNYGTITAARMLNGSELSRKEMKNVLNDNFFEIMEKNFMVWLPTQFAGCLIQCAPLKYLIVVAVSVGWFGYLSNQIMAKGGK